MREQEQQTGLKNTKKIQTYLRKNQVLTKTPKQVKSIADPGFILLSEKNAMVLLGTVC